MVFDPPARSRGRILGRVIWPLLIVAALVVAVVVSAAGDDTRVELDYVDHIQAQAIELAKSGDALRDVVSRLHRIERTELVTVIEGIEEDLTVGLEFVEQDAPTERYEVVRSLYRQTLLAWEAGTVGYRDSVLLAADEPQNTLVVDAMADSLAELRTGDNLYIDLLDVMAQSELPQPPSPMPPVMLQPAEGSLVSRSVSYIDSARSSSNGLALRPGLAVSQLLADPAWSVDPSGQAVIPSAAEIVFSVVITNAGNVISNEDVLVVTLTGGPEQIRQQIEIAPLAPGQQTTITADPMSVEPSGVYEVEAALAISENDVNFDDNLIAVEFRVNDG